MKEIATIIKERRKAMKLTQADLAAASGVNIKTIRSLEKEQRSAGIQVLLKLCDALGLQLTIEIKKPA